MRIRSRMRLDLRIVLLLHTLEINRVIKGRPILVHLKTKHAGLVI